MPTRFPGRAGPPMTATERSTPAVAPWDRVITPRTLLAVSLVCFFAWVFSVYDYTLFGTLLPVIAEDFGWSAAFAAGSTPG